MDALKNEWGMNGEIVEAYTSMGERKMCCKCGGGKPGRKSMNNCSEGPPSRYHTVYSTCETDLRLEKILPPTCGFLVVSLSATGEGQVVTAAIFLHQKLPDDYNDPSGRRLQFKSVLYSGHVTLW